MAGIPALLPAQYSQNNMGEYLHYAVVAAHGGVYTGINGIGYSAIFGTPSLFKTNTSWVDPPSSKSFNTANHYFGQPSCISDDGTTVFGRLTGFNDWVGFR